MDIRSFSTGGLTQTCVWDFFWKHFMCIYWSLKNCTAKPLALSYHILELLWKKCNSNRAWEKSHFSPNRVFITVTRVNGCWSEEPVSRLLALGGWTAARGAAKKGWAQLVAPRSSPEHGSER